MKTTDHLWKVLELSSPVIKAITCLHPNEKIHRLLSLKDKDCGIIGLCEVRGMFCFIEDWRIYGDSDVPVEWIKKAD